MLKILKTKSFSRWAKKEGVSDSVLKSAVDEILEGKMEAELGAGLVKKRIARFGQGKRGGYRTLIACNFDNRAVYLFGFAKSDRDNIEEDEKEVYKKLAAQYLAMDEESVQRMLSEKMLFEVKYETSR